MNELQLKITALTMVAEAYESDNKKDLLSQAKEVYEWLKDSDPVEPVNLNVVKKDLN